MVVSPGAVSSPGCSELIIQAGIALDQPLAGFRYNSVEDVTAQVHTAANTHVLTPDS